MWKSFYNNYKTLLKYFRIRSSYPYIVFTLCLKSLTIQKGTIDRISYNYILPYQEGCSSSFCLLHETLELTIVVKLVDFHQSNIYIPHNKEVTKTNYEWLDWKQNVILVALSQFRSINISTVWAQSLHISGSDWVCRVEIEPTWSGRQTILDAFPQICLQHS